MKRFISILLVAITLSVYAPNSIAGQVQALQQASEALKEVLPFSSKTTYYYSCGLLSQRSENNWSPELIVTSMANGTNYFVIVCFDTQGNVTGYGTGITYTLLGQVRGPLKNLITGGYVPVKGSILIYAITSFKASLIVTNPDIGVMQEEEDGLYVGPITI